MRRIVITIDRPGMKPGEIQVDPQGQWAYSEVADVLAKVLV